MKIRKAIENQPAICVRMGRLLQHVWRGNVAQMARDLHSSHPAMTRMLARQVPSGKILQLLASRADVDILWLLTGDSPNAIVAAPLGDLSVVKTWAYTVTCNGLLLGTGQSSIIICAPLPYSAEWLYFG